MAHPLGYDPVEASRERWLEHGWDDSASGMAAVVSVMRAEQIFQRRATEILRPLGLTFARYQVLGMLRWAGPLTLGAVGGDHGQGPPPVRPRRRPAEPGPVRQGRADRGGARPPRPPHRQGPLRR